MNAESVESIADAIVRLAGDADLRQSLRDAGRRHAAQFTWQRSAQQLLTAYNKVLNS